MTDTKNLNEDIPIIKFIIEPGGMGGVWSNDITPRENGGRGIPIPEHKELYEKCLKEGKIFHLVDVTPETYWIKKNGKK